MSGENPRLLPKRDRDSDPNRNPSAMTREDYRLWRRRSKVGEKKVPLSPQSLEPLALPHTLVRTLQVRLTPCSILSACSAIHSFLGRSDLMDRKCPLSIGSMTGLQLRQLDPRWVFCGALWLPRLRWPAASSHLKSKVGLLFSPRRHPTRD